MMVFEAGAWMMAFSHGSFVVADVPLIENEKGLLSIFAEVFFQDIISIRPYSLH